MKIPGNFKLCKPLSKSKNGVLHDRIINARTQVEIRRYIEKNIIKLFVNRTASEAKIINGNVSR
jgi:hypothetical protein